MPSSHAMPIFKSTLAPRPGRHHRRETRRRWLDRIVYWASAVNLALVVGVLIALKLVSERWWLSEALLFFPRAPHAAVALLLLPLSMLCCRKAVGFSVVAVLLVVGPIMGLNVPIHFGPGAPQISAGHLRIVSCNVQRYQPAFEGLIGEVTAAVPDVVVFQEAVGEHPLLDEAFPDWYSLHIGEYFVAARRPVRHVATFRSEQFRRDAAVVVDVEIDAGKIVRLVNLHLTSPRPGLMRLRAANVVAGDGVEAVADAMALRRQECEALREFFDEHCRDTPVVVAGDFNMPTDSNLYRSGWRDLQNAFDATSFGYGYTAPCSKTGFWPAGSPWLRIDHILASQHWHVHSCFVGSSNVSDHRLVAAILQMR